MIRERRGADKARPYRDHPFYLDGLGGRGIMDSVPSQSGGHGGGGTSQQLFTAAADVLILCEGVAITAAPIARTAANTSFFMRILLG